MWDALVQISQSEGLSGMYRGLGSANVQIVPYMGLVFTFQDAFKSSLSRLSVRDF